MREKMTPMELGFAWWIRDRNGVFHLRDLLKTRYIFEYRKLIRFLRLRGHGVDVTENRKSPGRNRYAVRPANGVWDLPERPKGPGRPRREVVRRRTEPFLPGAERWAGDCL